MLWRLAGTIFMLALSCTPGHQYLLEGNFYIHLELRFLHLLLRFLWLPPRGHSWIAWLWWPGDFQSWVAQSWSSWRDSCWQVAIARVLHRQETLRYSFTLVFLWRRPLCLSWSFSLRGRFWFSTHLVFYGAGLKEHRLWMPSGAFPLLCSSLPVSPRKQLILFLQPWSLWLLPRGHNQIAWLWFPVGLMIWGPTELHIFLHF